MSAPLAALTVPQLAALTVPQLAALEILLEGRTQSEAAAGAAVDVRTVRRWLALPHFRAALYQVRAALAAVVHGRLQAAAFRAVEALDAALLDTNDVRIRIRAAQLVLQLSEQSLAAESRALQGLAAPPEASGSEPLSLSPRGPSAEQQQRADKTGHALVLAPGKSSSRYEPESPDGRFTRSQGARPLAVGRKAETGPSPSSFAASSFASALHRAVAPAPAASRENPDKTGHPLSSDFSVAPHSLAPADKSGQAARLHPSRRGIGGSRVKRRPPAPGRFQRLYLSPPGRGQVSRSERGERGVRTTITGQAPNVFSGATLNG